jgi:hypothetical protein
MLPFYHNGQNHAACPRKQALTPYAKIEVSQFNQPDSLRRQVSQEAPELASLFEIFFVLEQVLSP